MTALPQLTLRRAAALIAASLLMILAASPVSAQTPSADGDDKVTGQTYVRHDGGTDAGIAHCNNTATDPAPDNDTTDADVDSNDGGSRRQGNEPYSVIDPTEPSARVRRLERLLPDRPRRRLAGLRVLAGRRRDVDQLDRPRLPAGHVGGGHGLAPLRHPHGRRRPDRRLRQRRQPVRRRHRLQPRRSRQNGDVCVATYGTNPHPAAIRSTTCARVVVGEARRPRCRAASSRTSRCSRSTAPAAQRRQRLRLLEPLHRRRPEQGLLQPLHRLRQHLLASRSRSPDPKRSSRSKAATSRSRRTATSTSPSAPSRQTRTRSPAWASPARPTAATASPVPR